MKRIKKQKILFVTEGTYPYAHGGVSTWSHILCNEIKDKDFYIYSTTAHYEVASKFTISSNIKNIIQLPIWSTSNPQDFIDYGVPYYQIVKKKYRTTDVNVSDKFTPLFTEFLNIIYAEKRDIDSLNDCILNLWRYFELYDYTKTFKSIVTWTVFKNKIEQQFPNSNISIHDINFSLLWLTKTLLYLSIKIPRTDLVHITLTGFAIIPAVISKYKYKTPILATEHGVFLREKMIYVNSSAFSFISKDFMIKCSEAIAELAYQKSDIITSVNLFNTKWEKTYGATDKQIKIIYNGIDHLRFNLGEKPAHLKNTPTVVAVARIFELKDILTMIKSCYHVKKEIPNVKYLVYGDKNSVPKYTKECINLINKLELEDNFILAGHHSEPEKIFLEGDISILTSISEGFPYTVLESMSCGIPVVATDVGGVTEAINKDCGFVCKPKAPKEIAEKVIVLLKNDTLRKEMGINSRRRIVENFTIAHFISSYREIYDSM